MGKLCYWRVVVALFVMGGLVSLAPLLAQKAVPNNPSSSSHEKSNDQGRALFASCAACHGADGGGERAPNIATASEVQQMSDGDLIAIVENGIPGAGMPAFNSLGRESIKAIVGYLRVLQGTRTSAKLPGDPQAGELLFFGNAQCSTCHTLNGRGGFIASDLSLYGSHETPGTVREAITDPEKALPTGSKGTIVVTRTGQKFTGMVRSNDNFSLALQTMDGSFHFFQKSDLQHIEMDSYSLMPDNYGSKLDSREIDSLVSYLLKIGAENAIHGPKDSSVSRSHHEDGWEK